MLAPPQLVGAPPKTFHVRVRIDAVRRHLSAADGTDYSAADVLQWLSDAGFTPSAEGWLVAEADLGHLYASEVEEIRHASPDCN